jgi:hypothetical protein
LLQDEQVLLARRGVAAMGSAEAEIETTIMTKETKRKTLEGLECGERGRLWTRAMRLAD